MIVAKFGGTAVTPQNLIYLRRIVGSSHKIVVVSAVGREFVGDVKVTDMLLAYHASPSDALWQAIADKYLRLAQVNAIVADVDVLLTDARQRAARFDAPYCASLGEELSARLVAAYLDADYLEAEQVVRFAPDGQLQAQRTLDLLQKSVQSGKLYVMGGFYGGSDRHGRRTFPRGGGDISGALAAAAAGAHLYENWTDANGVCVADPTLVPDVATVDGLSYAQMRLLSQAGAEVLHPDAVLPCCDRCIPIKIGNFFRPYGPSTLISNCPSQNRLLSLAQKATVDGYVTTLLHSYPQWQILDKIARFLRSRTSQVSFFDRSATVDPSFGISFEAHVVRISSPDSILRPLYDVLVRT